MEHYYCVDSVEVTFARNGFCLSFWGRVTPDGGLEKFNLVFNNLESTLSAVKSLALRKKLEDADKYVLTNDKV